jgi:hypothetical protein
LPFEKRFCPASKEEKDAQTQTHRADRRDAATLALALVAAGVAGADSPRANFCDVEDVWAAAAGGTVPGNQGAVFFNIFNQAPPEMEDDDESETFELATQLALGLGNAGEGDKYHWQVETVLVTNGATLRGHGFLFVPDSGMATFVVAGKGTHPLADEGSPGSITVSGGGTVACVAEEGMLADADVAVVWEDGTTDENVSVEMAHCEVPKPFAEGCTPPEPEID